MNTSALRHPRHRDHRHPRRRASRLLPALLLIAGLGLLPAGAARAGGLPSPLELHHDVRDAVSDLLRTLSYVPVSIHLHTRHLDAFFYGNEYYAPHRHNHAVYRFPVWVGNDVSYRPYSYCNGQLYGHHSSRPRLWVEWGSLHSGHWFDHCHGYFPSAHGHFKIYPRYRTRHYRYDRHRYDRHRHRHDRYCGHYRYDRHGGRHDRNHGWNSRRHHRRDHDVRRDRDRGHRRDHRWNDRRHHRRDHDVRRDGDRGRRDDRRGARNDRRDRRDDRERGDRRGRGHRRHRGGGD